MLGQGEDGWQKIRQVYQASDSLRDSYASRSQFFTDLRHFLRETGYIP
ncbi:MAG: hypothetical protein VKL59_23375 [Nostocaceae cyanobacterium]|nr:hypothetical protein [Nostocaceae cyanobacterium]